LFFDRLFVGVQAWEKQQQPGLFWSLNLAFLKVFTFLRKHVFGGWGKWCKETFVIGEAEFERYMLAVKTSPLHSVFKLRALESVYNLSHGSRNQLIMIQSDILPLLILEIKQAHDGSAQQRVALAIVRNLCMHTGYRIVAAKEMASILIAVCWAVEDNTCKHHALGALANLAANQRPAEILLDHNVRAAHKLPSCLC